MECDSWTPAKLLQLSNSYWSTCALQSAVKLDIFTPLSGSARTAVELSDIIKVDKRAMAMLLDAMTAMNLLDKSGDSYTAVPFACQFLSRDSAGYLGHIIMHHHHLIAGWARLDEAILNGTPLMARVSHGNDEQARESFLMGMFNLAMLNAPKVTAAVDLTGRRRLLDLGGGPGTYAIHFCKCNPDLLATVYDLPSTRRFAEKTVAGFGLTDRVNFIEGDYLTKAIDGRYDAAWLSHILHGESAAGCAMILEKTMASLEPGAMIMVQEFIMDDDRKGPLFPALFSLNMLLHTPGGQAYSQSELSGMLAAAGAINIRRLDIELPNGAGIMVGDVPG